MEHVVTQPTEPFTSRDGKLEVHQVPAWKDNLIWLAVCAETREAAVVDGPPSAEPVLAHCEEAGLKLTTILNTHTHPDHVGINQDLERLGKLPGLRVFGPERKAADVPGLTDPVDEGSTATVGRLELSVLLTEGHIDGHVSYLYDDVLFCGDTLFAAGCGYLFDGPPEKMFDSLTRLMELDPGTRVCCAHEYTEENLRFAWTVEPDNEALAERIREVWAIRAEGRCTLPSTIGAERATNPFVRHGSETLRQRVAAAWPDRDLSSPQAVFAATRALKDRKDYKSQPDSSLPL
ncbi:MAG TPA: hydroxyacylglutathione hydrolase [Sandaracinaceae bacterium LLY-WYZ-13_1]|nr:hydroxyacylglutathione hydrolase [Sandaracinaceae bacterium LLY-WYZ-13_1]